MPTRTLHSTTLLCREYWKQSAQGTRRIFPPHRWTPSHNTHPRTRCHARLCAPRARHVLMVFCFWNDLRPILLPPSKVWVSASRNAPTYLHRTSARIAGSKTCIFRLISRTKNTAGKDAHSFDLGTSKRRTVSSKQSKVTTDMN